MEVGTGVQLLRIWGAKAYGSKVESYRLSVGFTAMSLLAHNPLEASAEIDDSSLDKIYDTGLVLRLGSVWIETEALEIFSFGFLVHDPWGATS